MPIVLHGDFTKVSAFDVTDGSSTVTINCTPHNVNVCVCNDCKKIREEKKKKEEAAKAAAAAAAAAKAAHSHAHAHSHGHGHGHGHSHGHSHGHNFHGYTCCNHCCCHY
ncbi:hypothetical protein GGI12_005708 [Dipsacomyces acuminosporus]|nr:hypothetical protein GGI12_005708 [Dipsacomyces acuminosporus]